MPPNRLHADMHVRVPQGIILGLQMLMTKSHRSMNAEIVVALEAWLESQLSEPERALLDQTNGQRELRGQMETFRARGTSS